MLWTALNPSNQSVVAVLHPDCVSSGSLRVLLLSADRHDHNNTPHPLLMTLTHRLKLLDATETTVRALCFINDATLCCVTDRELVVWDVTRGVVAGSVAADHEQTYLHASVADRHSSSGNSNSPQLLLLVQTSMSSRKCQVHVYDAQALKLVRKVKVGKEAICVASHSDDSAIVVRGKDSVKVVSSETGSRLQKYENLESEDHANIVVADGIAITMASHSQLLWMNLETKESHLIDIPAEALPSSTTDKLGMQLVSLKDDSGDCLLWLGQALYVVRSQKDAKNQLQLQCRLMIDSTQTEHWSICMGTDSVVAVTQQENDQSSGGEFRMQNRTMDQVMSAATSEGATWNLSVTTQHADGDKTSQDASASSRKSKRKNEASILGPGRMGGEAREVTDVASTKRVKVEGDEDMDVDDEDEDDNDGGPTVAERLAELQKALDEESEQEDLDEAGKDSGATGKPSFSSKRATTESLSQLLQQALQSGDEQMLELALQVRDKKVIEESCVSISSEQATILLAALTTRMAIKPGRADHVCSWLSILLQTNKIKSRAHLQPLQNLLEERVEVFPALLRLEGRLSMMGSK